MVQLCPGDGEKHFLSLSGVCSCKPKSVYFLYVCTSSSLCLISLFPATGGLGSRTFVARF
jgi:hypothetical protein